MDLAICYCGSSEELGKCWKLLQIAQSYELNRLKEACIEKAKRTNFKELKNDQMYEKITLANYRRIVEGIVETLQRDLLSKKSDIQTLRSASQNKTSVTLKKLENINFKELKNDQIYEKKVLPAVVKLLRV